MYQTQVLHRSYSEEITDIYESSKQTEYALRKIEEWKEDLQSLIQRQFPNLRLVLTGSSASRFATQGSDCDFTLINISSWSSCTSGYGPSVLRDVERLLRSADRNNRLVTELISSAVVPILILKDLDRGLEGDIGYEVHNSIYNTFLVRCYGNMDPRVRPLATAVKTWAKSADIVNAKKHKLSGFAVVLLVFHYLQHGCNPPILPSLQQKYPSFFNRNTPHVAYWLEQDYTPPDISDHKSVNFDSLEVLFKGFFHYYSNFNWSQVISIRTGNFIPLPYGNKKWTKPYIRIEDPSDLTNVTRAIYEYFEFDEIRQAIRAASQKLDCGKRIQDVIF